MNWATISVIFQMLVWVDTNPSNGSCKQKTAGQVWHELRLDFSHWIASAPRFEL